MRHMFDNPQVEETFGRLMQFKGEGLEEEVKLQQRSDEEEEDPGKRDEKQKGDIIRTFALNQIASIPTMFRGHLEPQVLSDIIAFLVKLNYFTKDTSSDDIQQLAQFKLYGLVQTLYNVRVSGTEDLRKGMKSEGDLWITEVNNQIQKNYQTGKPNGMTKKHTEVMLFIAENVSKHRQRAMKISSDAGKAEEVRLREKVHYKRILSFELLLNNLALLLMIPEMFEEISENIEEIQICYVNLGLSTFDTKEGKRSKTKAVP
jgi:hypothetical protein